MPIHVTQIVEEDIPSAVQCIQQAFHNDPYNHWVATTLSMLQVGFQLMLT